VGGNRNRVEKNSVETITLSECRMQDGAVDNFKRFSFTQCNRGNFKLKLRWKLSIAMELSLTAREFKSHIAMGFLVTSIEFNKLEGGR